MNGGGLLLLPRRKSFEHVAFMGTPEGREPGFLDPFFVGVGGVEAEEDEDVSGSGGCHECLDHG